MFVKKKQTVMFEDTATSSAPSSSPSFLIEPTFDNGGVQASAGIDQQGKEVPDPVPMSPPIGYTPPQQLDELIRAYVRRELSAAAAQDDFETFDEADDFDIEDDPLDPLTEYEKIFEAPVVPPQAASKGA